MSVFPLLYLLSGVVLNTVSQHITDLRFSAPEAHIIPFVKFSATLVGAALRRPARSAATREQAWLMAAIGLLDASAYTVYCLGFFRLVRPFPLQLILFSLCCGPSSHCQSLSTGPYYQMPPAAVCRQPVLTRARFRLSPLLPCACSQPSPPCSRVPRCPTWCSRGWARC